MNTKVEEILKGAEDWCKGCPDLSRYIDIFTEDDANNPIIMAAKLSLLLVIASRSWLISLTFI